MSDLKEFAENIIKKINSSIKYKKNVSVLWASSREIFNLHQAQRSNCKIITLGHDLISKLKSVLIDLIYY